MTLSLSLIKSKVVKDTAPPKECSTWCTIFVVVQRCKLSVCGNNVHNNIICTKIHVSHDTKVEKAEQLLTRQGEETRYSGELKHLH